MAIEFAELEGEVPDEIPIDVVRAHQRLARRTVTRHARNAAAERWEERIARLTLVVAVVAGMLAVILMGMTLKPVRLPLLGLGILAAVAAGGAAWARR